MRSMNTELLEDIGEFVAERQLRRGVRPTITDIQEKFHIARGTAHKYLTTAERKGYCSKASKYLEERFSLGEIIDSSASCGAPTYEDAVIKEYVKLPGSVFGEDDKIVVWANGDSMTGAGIDDDDVLIVSKRTAARDGEIIIATLNGATTLKTLRHHEDGRPYLHPENSSYDDIEINEDDEFYIQGVLSYIVKSVRGYRSDTYVRS